MLIEIPFKHWASFWIAVNDAGLKLDHIPNYRLKYAYQIEVPATLQKKVMAIKQAVMSGPKEGQLI